MNDADTINFSIHQYLLDEFFTPMSTACRENVTDVGYDVVYTGLCEVVLETTKTFKTSKEYAIQTALCRVD